MQLRHRPRHQVGAGHHVDRQALRDGHQLGACGQDAAGEVAPGVDDARACRPQQRVLHLAGDALDAAAEDRQVEAVGRQTLVRVHAACLCFRAVTCTTRPQRSSRRKVASGSITMVVNGVSTIAWTLHGLARRQRREVMHRRVTPSTVEEDLPRTGRGLLPRRRHDAAERPLAQVAGDPGTPVDELDLGRRVLEGEDLLVQSVKVGGQVGNVTLAAETARTQRQLDLPDLLGVARLDAVRRSSADRPPSTRSTKACGRAFSSRSSTAFTASRSKAREFARRNSALSSLSGQSSPPTALSAAPASGKSTCRQPRRRAIATLLRPAAPPPPIRIAARGSMPWLTVMSSIAPRHGLGRERQDGERRPPRRAIPSGRATSFSIAVARPIHVSRIRPPRKLCRIEVAQHQRRVGHGRRVPPPRRSRPGRARRPCSPGRHAAGRPRRPRRCCRRRRRRCGCRSTGSRSCGR